jgi:NAD(P)-dependent dehydrogenase (short-subunit alcohol dehydrogenase family)
MRYGVGILVFILIGAVSCGGGGGGGTGSGGPPGPVDPPAGSTRVTVVARDAFGSPVPGASITLLESKGTGILELNMVTDAHGRAEVVGGFEDVYAAMLTATDLFGISYEPRQPADDQIEFDVTLHPSSGLTPGIGRVTVTGGSADGRRLEFSARLYVVEGSASEGQDLEAWNIDAVGVLPCAADCVAGPAGFDAAYQGSTLNQDWVDPEPLPAPLALALLLDQGMSVALTDPMDRRLLAARYLQTRLGPDDQVALAAFAADDAGTGQAASLPEQPVTLFPTDNPGFTPDGRAYFPVIDSLATLSGGSSPLHAALAELIDFTATAAPPGNRGTVVALASSDVSDCGSPADCRAAQDALRAQSGAADVPVVVAGLSGPSAQADRRRLGPFAQFENGAVFWVQDARQVPTLFGRMPEIVAGRHGTVDVTIRLESPVTGAFAPGNMVVGTLQVVICPWDCTELLDVPFGLHIP